MWLCGCTNKTNFKLHEEEDEAACVCLEVETVRRQNEARIKRENKILCKREISDFMCEKYAWLCTNLWAARMDERRARKWRNTKECVAVWLDPRTKPTSTYTKKKTKLVCASYVCLKVETTRRRSKRKQDPERKWDPIQERNIRFWCVRNFFDSESCFLKKKNILWPWWDSFFLFFF